MLYFAYGSNLNFEQMAFRCPAAKFISKVTLPDYFLKFRRGGYATVEPQKGEVVEGAIWEITKECLEALDRYEGYPRFYYKNDVEVFLPDGTATMAMVYIMQGGYAVEPPTKQYYNTLVQGFVDCQLDINNLYKAVENALNLAGKTRYIRLHSDKAKRRHRAY